jgi:hypothetical protein
VAAVLTGLAITGCTSGGSERSSGSAGVVEDETARAQRLALGAAAAQTLTERARAGTVADNVLPNGSFEVWSQLPEHWNAVEQETLAKTSRADGGDTVHDGTHALRIVADRGVVSLGSDALLVTDSENTNLRGKMVTAGVWAKTDAPTAAFINIRDGIDESPVVDHPGDGTWQFLAVSYTLSPNANRVVVRIGNRKQDDKTVVLLDGAVLVTPAH